MSRLRFATSHRRLLFLAPLLVTGLSLLSCGREVTGPDGGQRFASFALAPAFPSAFAVEGSGDVVPFNRVRITLDRLDGSRIETRLVEFPADVESVELDLSVPLPFGTTSEGIDVILNMQYINAAGDTVFRVGPQQVTVVPTDEGEPSPIVPVDVEYVGTGANADFVVIQPSGGVGVAGTTTTFSATAYDPSEDEIPGTPFVFSSPDATHVTITPQGVATWLPVRGAARIIATLPTGELADTTTFTVSLPASQLQVVSGSGQAAEAGASLEEPIVLRVVAADAVPVPGVTVTFAVATGGGQLTPLTAVSDVDGLVTTDWTLGALVGAQSITATFTGIVGGPVTITALAGQTPAADLQYVSGDEQTGVPGQALAAPLVVRAVDGQGNGVPGVPVTFTSSLGGGTFAPVTATTDGTGHASSAWTLGPSTGPQGAIAETPGVDVQIGFTAIAASAGVAVWTGAVSFDWSVPGNWDIGALPSATDSVVIPAVTNQPRLTQQVIVGAVNVTAGTLWLNGQTLGVLRTFATTGSGVLVMQEEASALSVVGNARFAGGSTSGLLTHGIITVAGDFTQDGTNSAASFQADTGLITALTAPSPTLLMTTPGRTIANSHFGHLYWSTDGGTLTQLNGVSIVGDYVISSSQPVTHVGVGGAAGRFLEFRTLTALAPVTFDNVRVIAVQLSDGEDITLTNLTFRNLPTTATQLQIVHPGGSEVTIDNVTFETTPTTGGLYLRASDAVPADQVPLVVNVANPTPATPGGFTLVDDGAVINWPASSDRGWIGITSTDWNDPSNWSPAAVPGALDRVTIFPGASFAPVLATTTTIGHLDVTSSGSLTLVASGILTVNGDIVADGNIAVDAVNAALRAAGVGRTVRGNIENLLVSGVYSLAGPLDVANDLIITGSLNPAGWALTTTDLVMNSAGVLVMQDVEDVVTATGQALFFGGPTEGLLTNGVLRVGARLASNSSGTGSPQNSLSASGAHIVRPIGAGPVELDLAFSDAGPGTSHLATLDLTGFGGSVTLPNFNTTYVTGRLIAGAGATLTTTNSGQLHTAGVSVSALTIDGVRLTIGAGDLDQFDNVSFNDFPSNATQLTIAHPGNATPFQMSGLIFSSAPATGGAYISATDTDGPTGNTLVLNLLDAAPTSPGGFTTVANGAVINWPMGAPVRLWTGANSTLWSDAANWQGGVLPASTDSVRITAAAPNDPVLEANTLLRGLEVETGAAMDLSSWVLTVQGDLVAPAVQAIAASGLAQLELQAAGAATVRGALPSTVIDNGLYTLSGELTVNGALTIRNNGHLSITATQGVVTGNLITLGGGVLAMSGPAMFQVNGDASFSGGSTAGLLTGGSLRVGGAFSQGGANADAFQAGPGHTVELIGATTQAISFQNPDLALNTACSASCFGTLSASKGSGEGDISFVTGAKAVTQLSLAADAIIAGTNLLLSGGAPSFTSLNVQAGAIGFVSGLTRFVETFAVDSLIGFGNDFPLPPNLDRPTRLAGSYLINAPHNAALVVTFGALDVDGVASINGDLVMNANGWLRMQQPSDTLTVNGNVQAAGNSPISQLTSGVLAVNGNFAQTQVGASSFNPEPAHKTRIIGPGALVQFTAVASNRFGSLEFATSGAQITSGANVSGDVIVRSTSGPVTGTIGQTIVVNGGLYDTTGGRWQVPVTRFNNAEPALPALLATNVELMGTFTAQEDMSFGAGLTVASLAEFVPNGNRVSVIGPFATQGDGRVRMTNTADTLSLSGSATFGGGSTAGLLTAGMLELHGDFAQSGSPSSFSASGTHQTWFHGMADQQVGFANPGTGAGASHFNDVGLAMGSEGASAVLVSDVWADGRLMTIPSTSRRLSASPTRRVIHSRGADIQFNIFFDNVGWALVDGAAMSPINGVTFENMDPSQAQFSIARSGGTVPIAGPEFTTVPVASQYLLVTDVDGAANGVLDVLVTGASPTYHGGLVQLSGGATLTGWNAGPSFLWTGAVNNSWTEPGNWADNLVPAATDSVHFSDGYVNAPVFPGQVTLRAFVADVTQFLNMSGELTVTERLVMPAAVDCDGGEIILAGGANPVSFAGNIGCGSVRVTSGTAVPDGRVTVASDLSVWAEAELILGRNTVVAPFFQTLGNGRLRMVETTDSLIVDAATFGGGSTNGLLTDGVLVISGNFTQDAESNSESFAASGNHRTVFGGLGNNQQSFFATPGEGAGTSHFANVEMSKGEAGTHVVLNTPAYALGVLSTGTGVPAQRFLANVTEPMTPSVLFQSHGADVENITFSNVKWSILDGAAIGRMDQITFVAIDSAATHLNIERSGGDVIGIRQIVFGPEPQEGDYIRIVDLDGATGGTLTVNVDGVTPSLRQEQFIVLVNGALLTGWPIG